MRQDQRDKIKAPSARSEGPWGQEQKGLSMADGPLFVQPTYFSPPCAPSRSHLRKEAKQDPVHQQTRTEGTLDQSRVDFVMCMCPILLQYIFGHGRLKLDTDNNRNDLLEIAHS